MRPMEPRHCHYPTSGFVAMPPNPSLVAGVKTVWRTLSTIFDHGPGPCLFAFDE